MIKDPNHFHQILVFNINQSTPKLAFCSKDAASQNLSLSPPFPTIFSFLSKVLRTKTQDK